MPHIRRSFSAEFKPLVVLQFLGSVSSQAEPCPKHNHKSNLFADCRAAVLDRLATMPSPEQLRLTNWSISDSPNSLTTASTKDVRSRKRAYAFR